MSNRFQDFYNEQREWKGSSNQQLRKSFFNHERKQRRTRTFDLFRGDIASYEPEEIKPIPKFTFRDAVIKLGTKKKNQVIKKQRPFVVGTVKHKIHSPPFLHEPYKSRESKKKITSAKSFAPSNYKFKGPKGLELSLTTPFGGENASDFPFSLNTVWNKLDNKSMKKKNILTQDNITVRSHKKRFSSSNSSSNSVYSTKTMSEVNQNGEKKNAKRELWPEDLDEEPVFGRLNLKRISQQSCDSLPKDNEKETNDSSQVKIDNLVPDSSANIEFESTKNPDANTSKSSNEYENLPSNSKEMTMMNSRVSQISPAKTVLLNTINNFDHSKIHVETDNTNLVEDSLPSAQIVLKIIPQQVENSSNATTPSTTSTIQNTVKEFSPSSEGRNSISKIDRISLDSEAVECTPGVMSRTYTKYSTLIEEDEQDEEVELNLEKTNKEDNENNISSSLVTEVLKLSNVNKINVDSENLHEKECEPISADSNTPTSKNTSSERENVDSSKKIPSPSKSTLQDNCREPKIDAIQENMVSPRESPEKQINQSINKLSGIESNQNNPDKDKNVSLDSNGDSDSPKSIDNAEANDQIKISHCPPNINIWTPSQVEKENGLAAKTQLSFNSTDGEKTVSNQTPSQVHTPKKRLSFSIIEIKRSPSARLENPVLQAAEKDEGAHAGSVQTSTLARRASVVDLTNSPKEPTRRSAKPLLQYKSSSLMSNQKYNPPLMTSDENVIIDLISDEEEDYTIYVNHLRKKYAGISNSPKESPKNRSPLASIENIQRLNSSSSRTPQSPLANQPDSPAKKTPNLLPKSIPKVHISPPPEPLEVLQDTPRKTPRRRNVVKEVATEPAETLTPMRVMCLRNRSISCSPSPKKKTTPIVTPFKTPVAVKEVATDANEDGNILRVMHLRTRKINVSPSPKKLTPRRRKNDNQCA